MYCTQAEKLFKVGQIISVQPPDRIAKHGFGAEILEIDSNHCRYKLLDDGTEFDVTELMLKR